MSRNEIYCRRMELEQDWAEVGLSSTWTEVGLGSTWTEVGLGSTWTEVGLGSTWAEVGLGITWAVQHLTTTSGTRLELDEDWVVRSFRLMRDDLIENWVGTDLSRIRTEFGENRIRPVSVT